MTGLLASSYSDQTSIWHSHLVTGAVTSAPRNFAGQPEESVVVNMVDNIKGPSALRRAPLLLN